MDTLQSESRQYVTDVDLDRTLAAHKEADFQAHIRIEQSVAQTENSVRDIKSMLEKRADDVRGFRNALFLAVISPFAAILVAWALGRLLPIGH